MTKFEWTIEQVQNELAELFDEEAGNKKRGKIDDFLKTLHSCRKTTKEESAEEAYDRAMKDT